MDICLGRLLLVRCFFVLRQKRSWVLFSILRLNVLVLFIITTPINLLRFCQVRIRIFLLFLNAKVIINLRVVVE
jgi:hypothetical protein